MGFCSGTEIFDPVVNHLLGTLDGTESNRAQIKAVILKMAQALEDHDWDCQGDSSYFDDPIVQEVFQELHPDWDRWEPED